MNGFGLVKSWQEHEDRREKIDQGYWACVKRFVFRENYCCLRLRGAAPTVAQNRPSVHVPRLLPPTKYEPIKCLFLLLLIPLLI